MIPKASQRKNGAELAAHLMNVHQNEYVEIAEIRGAIATDLAGAFEEWEAQAHALTKCEKYLYSLSINPDETQGRLSREQYLDYIDRVEQRQGLAGQDRAVIFHIKDGREHAHVVWSRIDVENEKAIHMAFDQKILKMVTMEFAQEHGLKLPDGYHQQQGAHRKLQPSQYEMSQKRKTGLSKHDHVKKVGEIWSQSDSPKAFVNGLADSGYLLSTGKQPYVVVDFYGGMHALPRLLGERKASVVDYLKDEYPPDSLPTVDEAVELVASYRRSLKTHTKEIEKADNLNRLKRSQAKRREVIEREASTLWEKQAKERAQVRDRQLLSRRALRTGYLNEQNVIDATREQRRPKGLAEFLGRVTGVNFARKILHAHQDKKRFDAYQEKRNELRNMQRLERADMSSLHTAQGLAMRKRLNSFERTISQEKRALEDAHKKKERTVQRSGGKDMPSLGNSLTPRGRRALPHKAKTRYYKPHTVKEISEHEKERIFPSDVASQQQLDIDLKGRFNRNASRDNEEDERDDGEGKHGDSRGGPPHKKNARKDKRKPRKRRSEKRSEEHENKPKRTRRRDRGLDKGL